MEIKERKVYLQAKLRNLKRTYAKLLQHADLLEETKHIKKEINNIEKELSEL